MGLKAVAVRAACEAWPMGQDLQEAQVTLYSVIAGVNEAIAAEAMADASALRLDLREKVQHLSEQMATVLMQVEEAFEPIAAGDAGGG